MKVAGLPAVRQPKPRRTRDRFPTQVSAAEVILADSLPAAAHALVALATGYKRTRKSADGEVEVYDVPPDYRAVEGVLSRVMGKWEGPAEPNAAVGSGSRGGRTDSLLVLLRDLNAAQPPRSDLRESRAEVLDAEDVEIVDSGA